MAEFVRPELKSAFWRWRELIASLFVLGLGLFISIETFGFLRWIGWVLVGSGFLLVIAGIQRGRFRQGTGGIGVVTVDEGRLGYFGPLTGGTVALDDMTGLSLDRRSTPPHWVLTARGNGPVFIPIDAEGADELFDLFSALPGIDTGVVLDALSRTGDDHITIWHRTTPLSD